MDNLRNPQLEILQNQSTTEVSRMNQSDYIVTRFLSKKHLIEAINQIFADDKMIRAKDVELIFEKFGDSYNLVTQTVVSGYDGWSDSKKPEEDSNEVKNQ